VTLAIALRHRFRDGFTLDVDVAVPARGVTALFGPSGSGKSSILSAVAGLLRPDSGRVALAGIVLLDTVAGAFVAPERRRCGVVFQDARLFPHLSVAANLRYGLRRAPPGIEGPGFEEVVALLGLEALLARRPLGLSGGERQRVALGRALLARPRLLLMDEPLAALDAARRAEVLPFLARLAAVARLPVLYVTHALDEVDALAQTLVLLDRGAVRAAGGVEALSARPDVRLLALRRDAGALLGCTVLGHATDRGLTRLGFPGGEIWVPLRPEPPGAAVRLRVRARDVGVALRPPDDIAVHNILPCTIAGIAEAGTPDEVFLQLRIGPSTLLARLARDSVSALRLEVGQAVFALMKTVAFDHAAPVGP
jgi:molybdate transport system ATP-binding protein